MKILTSKPRLEKKRREIKYVHHEEKDIVQKDTMEFKDMGPLLAIIGEIEECISEKRIEEATEKFMDLEKDR